MLVILLKIILVLNHLYEIIRKGKKLAEKKFQTIKVNNLDENIIIITLNREKFSNAFNTKMAEELIYLFQKMNIEEFPNLRCIIITGSGNKAFCAGGDLKERLGMDVSQWNKQHLVYEKMIKSILECNIPIIGAINGAAIGGGCEIVASLDFSFASEEAKFAQTEVKVGIIPGIGGTQNLTSCIGVKRAKELILTGRIFSAKEALKYGLINGIYKKESLMKHVIEYAKLISSNAPIAVRQAKKSIEMGHKLSLSEGMSFEIECYNKTINTNDRIEGIKAFNEKRKPNFKGN